MKRKIDPTPSSKCFVHFRRKSMNLFIRLNERNEKSFNKSFIFILDGQGYGVFMYGIFGNYKNKVK